MEECSFYKTEFVQINSSDMGSPHQPSHNRSRTCHWCSHPNSPAPEDVAMIGQDQPLKCDGDLDRCQITKENFAEPFIKAK